MFSPEQRAKFVLDVCAHELRSVEIIDLGTIEKAIQIQIEDALRDQMREFNRTIVNRASKKKNG